MNRDSTGRERETNPNARSAHAARHIYIYIYNPEMENTYQDRHVHVIQVDCVLAQVVLVSCALMLVIYFGDDK